MSAEVFITNVLVPIAVTVLAIFAGTGFWQWVLYGKKKEDNDNQLIMGLGRDHIIQKCECYLERGYITHGELESFESNVITPYRNNGGNGTALQLAQKLYELPRHNPQLPHPL